MGNDLGMNCSAFEKVEKGADANLFYSEKQHFDWSKFALKIGMLAMGIALGVIVATILSKTSFLKRDEVPLYFSMIFFFGGLSLVLFYIIDRKSK